MLSASGHFGMMIDAARYHQRHPRMGALPEKRTWVQRCKLLQLRPCNCLEFEQLHPPKHARKLNLCYLTHPTWKSQVDGVSSVIAGHPRSASDDDLRGTHLHLADTGADDKERANQAEDDPWENLTSSLPAQSLGGCRDCQERLGGVSTWRAWA